LACISPGPDGSPLAAFARDKTGAGNGSFDTFRCIASALGVSIDDFA